ncbi:hypothetical protein DFJ74DRAFT_774735 [Hyaloraphidium curvatum]|nr:hypothetical protein DFJ74DRAFT_774735 [Hyaloraphidium curvatum]
MHFPISFWCGICKFQYGDAVGQPGSGRGGAPNAAAWAPPRSPRWTTRQRANFHVHLHASAMMVAPCSLPFGSSQSTARYRIVELAREKIDRAAADGTLLTLPGVAAYKAETVDKRSKGSNILFESPQLADLLDRCSAASSRGAPLPPLADELYISLHFQLAATCRGRMLTSANYRATSVPMIAIETVAVCINLPHRTKSAGGVGRGPAPAAESAMAGRDGAFGGGGARSPAASPAASPGSLKGPPSEAASSDGSLTAYLRGAKGSPRDDADFERGRTDSGRSERSNTASLARTAGSGSNASGTLGNSPGAQHASPGALLPQIPPQLAAQGSLGPYYLPPSDPNFVAYASSYENLRNLAAFSAAPYARRGAAKRDRDSDSDAGAVGLRAAGGSPGSGSAGSAGNGDGNESTSTMGGLVDFPSEEGSWYNQSTPPPVREQDPEAGEYGRPEGPAPGRTQTLAEQAAAAAVQAAQAAQAAQYYANQQLASQQYANQQFAQQQQLLANQQLVANQQRAAMRSSSGLQQMLSDYAASYDRMLDGFDGEAWDWEPRAPPRNVQYNPMPSAPPPAPQAYRFPQPMPPQAFADPYGIYGQAAAPPPAQPRAPVPQLTSVSPRDVSAPNFPGFPSPREAPALGFPAMQPQPAAPAPAPAQVARHPSQAARFAPQQPAQLTISPRDVAFPSFPSPPSNPRTTFSPRDPAAPAFPQRSDAPQPLLPPAIRSPPSVPSASFDPPRRASAASLPDLPPTASAPAPQPDRRPAKRPSISLPPPPPSDDPSSDSSEDRRRRRKSGRRGHECDVCGKVFGTSGYLGRHKKVHTQDKPHQCPVPACQSTFNRHDNMLQHWRSHVRRLAGQLGVPVEELPEEVPRPPKLRVAGKPAAEDED